jgi:dihydroflavonol-4-reductase
MAGIDSVFHAAGRVRFDDAGRLLLWTINVEGTRQVLQAARTAGVRRLVQVSSSVTVGLGTLDHPATEESAPAADGTPYAESKRAAEALALGDWGSLEVVVCNPTFVVGAYGTGTTSAEVVRLVASGLLVAYPPGGSNFASADDIAEGLVLAMRHGRPAGVTSSAVRTRPTGAPRSDREECGQSAPSFASGLGGAGAGAPEASWASSPRRDWGG